MPAKKKEDEEMLCLSKKDKYLVFIVAEDDNGDLDSMTVLRNRLNYFEEIGVMEHHQYELLSEPLFDKTMKKYATNLYNRFVEKQILEDPVLSKVVGN